MKPETLETRLLKRIDRKRGDVFLRADFGDLGGYDQVGRALRKLVREGRLVKVGQGLYARARPSMTSGEPVPVGRAERAEGSAPPGWRGNAAEPAGAGLQCRTHHAGADRPRGRRDAAACAARSAMAVSR